MQTKIPPSIISYFQPLNFVRECCKSGIATIGNFSQYLWNPPEGIVSPQELKRSFKWKTPPQAERIDVLFRKREKVPYKNGTPALTSNEISLFLLFSIPELKNIPLDRSSVPLLEHQQKEWERKILYIDGAKYMPSADTEEYFNLARSLLDCFLGKHPFMNREYCLPSLRFTALRVAIKYLDDCVTDHDDFQDWLPSSGVTFEKLNQMEAAFLIALDWTIELL